MKKLLCLTLIFTCIILKSQAQIKFESGYFIDKDGKRTDCLIQNRGWKNNPTEFHYKELKKGKSKRAASKMFRNSRC